MASKKRPTGQKSESKVTPVDAATNVKPTTLSLPLQHYIPRLTFQLTAIGFCLYTAAAATKIAGVDVKGTGPSSTLSSLPSSVSSIILALVRDPIRFLATTNASLLAIQIWYGLWTRSVQLKLKQLHDETSQGQGSNPESAHSAARVVVDKKGFKGSMKAMVDRASKGEFPHHQALKAAREAHLSGQLDFGLDAIPRAVATTLAFALFFHTCAILLGAPLIANVVRTFLLSCLVSVLAITPLALTVPLSSSTKYTWLRIFSALTINGQLELALVAPAFGAMIGCWLGAIPIPLDWDRPWQAWPTTCVVGTIAGHALGSLLGLAGCVLWPDQTRSAASKLKKAL